LTGVIFDKPHFFYSPNKVIFAPNTIKILGSKARQLGVKKAFIVTDPRVIKANLLRPPLGLKQVVTSIRAHRDSSKGSNIGVDMDNSMGSMDMCSNMVEDRVVGGTGC
jgi:hypothetical protein